jgi:environmental stress-induced protein Ves
MAARLLKESDYKRMAWANGRGVTLELARENDADGAMLWRLSMADVVEDGAFSALPGVDRILMLIDGAGFDLDLGEHGVAPVEWLSPTRFSGDWTAAAANVRGPSRDLNVMVARGRADAELSIHDGRLSRVSPASRSLFLAVHGRWSVRIGETTFALASGETLAVREAGSGRVSGEGTGPLVQIDIWVASPERNRA